MNELLVCCRLSTQYFGILPIFLRYWVLPHVPLPKILKAFPNTFPTTLKPTNAQKCLDQLQNTFFGKIPRRRWSYQQGFKKMAVFFLKFGSKKPYCITWRRIAVKEQRSLSPDKKLQASKENFFDGIFVKQQLLRREGTNGA